VPRVGQVFLDAGELIVSRSCGGGGFGPPVERDPERVRYQVLEGFVSRDRARAVYAVVLGEDGAVLGKETDDLRAEATS
jgi:N-methylhydantoinase B